MSTLSDRAVPHAALQEMIAAVGGVTATRALPTGRLWMLTDRDGPAAALIDPTG
jgi:hypothetical protein